MVRAPRAAGVRPGRSCQWLQAGHIRAPFEGQRKLRKSPSVSLGKCLRGGGQSGRVFVVCVAEVQRGSHYLGGEERGENCPRVFGCKEMMRCRPRLQEGDSLARKRRTAFRRVSSSGQSV